MRWVDTTAIVRTCGGGFSLGVQKFYAGEDAYKTVLNGANETIWCTSNHSISNRVIWYKGGKELETTNRLVVGSGGQLLIFQATYNVSGVYECNFEGQLLPPGIKLFQRVFITVRGESGSLVGKTLLVVCKPCFDQARHLLQSCLVFL